MKPNSIDNCSFEEIFLDEEYEFNFPNFGKKEIVVIDAGANIGFGSVFFANRFKVSKLIAIEPEINNFNWLTKNTSKYSEITTIKGGLWNTDTFLLIKDNGWGTRFLWLKK